jgi:hypothetical protein
VILDADRDHVIAISCSDRRLRDQILIAISMIAKAAIKA